MKKTYLLLFALFVFGYLLRVAFLPNLFLTFGYDQARDAYIAREIIKGDLKILGPPASTPGLYHGVLYYYILAPAYLVGNGSPVAAAYWIAFLNSLTIFIIFYLVKNLTGKTGPAFLSALLFAVSFEASQYAVWLSNPTIGVWTVPLIYLGLWLWTGPKKKKSIGPLVAGFGLGSSIQAEIFLAYHIAPLLLWLLVHKKTIEKGSLVKFFTTLFITVSTMILSEVKFGFRSIGGFLSLLSAQDPIVLSRSLGDFLVLYLNQLGKVIAYNVYPGNIGYAGMFVLILVIYSLLTLKGKFTSWKFLLSIWILSHLTVVSVGGTSTPFLLVGIGPAIISLVAIYLFEWWNNYKLIIIFILFLILSGNISMILKENPRGQTIFAIQKDMLLAKQIKAIDYTYKESDNSSFSINSLTSPLWINIVWTYLYRWYGLPKYGYLPEWHGRDQIGQLDSLPNEKPDTDNYFLIIEPLAGIPERYLGETVSSEDARSKLIGERNFGEIVVQKREKNEK